MHDFNTVGGRIIEIRRCVNPLGLHGQDARRERWELWVKAPNGAEEKVVVSSRSMHARRGHHIVVALEAGEPVGMVNVTMRTRMNFARVDPPALYQPLDIAFPVGLMFASLFASALIAPGLFLVAVPIAVLYVPLLTMARRLSRRSTVSSVEDMLDRIERDGSLSAECQR
jgi:hypothetical protein